jgi:hypothetical protein
MDNQGKEKLVLKRGVELRTKKSGKKYLAIKQPCSA